MDSNEHNMWWTFVEKTEELFVLGYKLPSVLQVKAVGQVQDKLADWRTTLKLDDDNQTDDVGSCFDHPLEERPTASTAAAPKDGSVAAGSRDESEGEVSRPTRPSDGVRPCRTSTRKRKQTDWSSLCKDDSSADENVDEDSDGRPSERMDDVDALAEMSSHSDEYNDSQSKSSRQPSSKTKPFAGKNARNRVIRRHNRRRLVSKRIKRGANSVNIDQSDSDKKCLNKTVNEEAVVKAEVADEEKRSTDSRTGSGEDRKPAACVKRSRGRPRKLQTLPDSVFEGLNLTHKCSKCSKSYGTAEVLKCHMEAHKDKMPLVCSMCEKTYNSKGGFDNHIRTHDPDNQIQCPHCEFKYPSYTVMNRHVLMKHASVNSRPFLCDLCGKGFLQPSTLKVHMSTHDAEKNFACDQCEFRTHTKNILAVHKKNKHSPKEYYSCDLCGARVKYRGSLIEHRRRHFGEKPHQCSICSSRFTSRSQLAQHVRIHKEKTFMCDQCNKKFINKHKLARHMTIHTGEKSYACGFCSYQCNVRGNIRKHWLFVHKIDHDRRMQRVKVISSNATNDSKEKVAKPTIMNNVTDSQLASGDLNVGDGITSGQHAVETGFVSTNEVTTDQERVEFPKCQTSFSDSTPILEEMTSQCETFHGSVSVLSAPTDLPSVLTEAGLSMNGMPTTEQNPVTETVIHEGKVLELPVAGSGLSQDPIAVEAMSRGYPTNIGLETKVEVDEDGTQYVYVYLPSDQLSSQSSGAPSASTEYVVTMEETEASQATFSIHSII